MRIKCWLSDSLTRWFPLSKPSGQKLLRLDAARGERVSFQANLFLENPGPVDVSLTAQGPKDVEVTVRRVGCVPVPHHNTEIPAEVLDGVGHIPGYVPDPLFEESNAVAAPREVTSFWITVKIPPNAKPGVKKARLSLKGPEGAAIPLTAEIRISPVAIRRPREFRVIHFFYADALCDWYKVEPFSAAFWPIAEKYFRNYTAHGCDVMYVPAFTPPLDGVKRVTQLLGVKKLAKGRYEFNWRLVKRWVDLAKICGVRDFSWVHLFTQWGCKNAIRIYHGHGLDERLLWPIETPAASRTYRNFLVQYLGELERFLRRENIFDVSHFSVSDEPHGDEQLESYRKARAMLREIAPWMKTMDALSDIRFARMKLVDTPVPMISTARQFVEEGIPCWTSFCCYPRGKYANRFLDTPLARTRMLGWLFYRFGFQGFLHWGYNYWYKSQTRQLIDPFTVTDGLRWPVWAYGDTSVVYPGPAGPIDSIRWEVFADSLQDYALLETLGVERAGALLRPLRDFNAFPSPKTWIAAARRKLLFQE